MSSASGTTVTNTLFRSVRGQARGLGLVEDFDFVVNFVDDGEFRLFEGLLDLFMPVKRVAGLE